MLSFKQCTRNISYISRSHWRNHSHSQGPARGVLRSWPTGRQTQIPSSCNHPTLTQDRDRRLMLLSGDTRLSIILTIICTGNPFGNNTNTYEPHRIAPKNDVHAHAHKHTHTHSYSRSHPRCRPYLRLSAMTSLVGLYIPGAPHMGSVAVPRARGAPPKNTEAQL